MRIAVAFILLALCPGVAHAQTTELTQADRATIHDVIQDQMQAFQHDDARAAFGFASPSIQQQMGTPERFLDLVQNHYQPVYHPRSSRFGKLSTRDGLVIQEVELVGPDGRGALALYSMEHEQDGTWRISGCVLTDSRDVAT